MKYRHKFTKQLIVISFVIVLIATAFSAVQAQQKKETFSEETLQNLLEISNAKLKGATYRKKTIDERFSNGNSVPEYVEKTITENVPPDRRRYFEEKISGGETKTFESITIGNDYFYRFGNGEWKTGGFGIGIGSGQGEGSGDGKRIVTEKTIERNFYRNVKINNQTADLFETINTTKYTYLFNSYANIVKTSYWFDGKGRLIKSLDEYEQTEQKTISRSVREYEFDVNIKIEAPIKKKK